MLLLRRSQTDVRRPGQWDLPGGNVEDGEDFKQALAREAKEEAGIDLRSAELIFGISKYVEDINTAITWNFFVSRLADRPKVTLSYEHDEFKWVTPEAALQEVAYELHKTLLTYALEHNLLA